MLKYIQELDFKQTDVSIIKNKKVFYTSPQNMKSQIQIASQQNLPPIGIQSKKATSLSYHTEKEILDQLHKQSRIEDITRQPSLHALTSPQNITCLTKQKNKLNQILNIKQILQPSQIPYQESNIQELSNHFILRKQNNIEINRSHNKFKSIEEACASSLVHSICKEDFNQVSHSSYLKVANLQENILNELQIKKQYSSLYLFKCSMLASYIIYNKLFTITEFVNKSIQINKIEAQMVQPDTLFDRFIELYNLVRQIFKSKRKVVNILIKTQGFNKKLLQIYFKKTKDLPEQVPVEIYFDNQIEFEQFFHLRKNVTKELLIAKFILGFTVNEMQSEKIMQKIFMAGGNVFTNAELQQVDYLLIYNRMRKYHHQKTYSNYPLTKEEPSDILISFVKDIKLDLDFLNQTYYFLINLEDEVKVSYSNEIFLRNNKFYFCRRNQLNWMNTCQNNMGAQGSYDKIYYFSDRIDKIKEMIETDENPNLKSLVNHIEESEKKLGKFDFIKNDQRLRHIEINAIEKLFKSTKFQH